MHTRHLWSVYTLLNSTRRTRNPWFLVATFSARGVRPVGYGFVFMFAFPLFSCAFPSMMWLQYVLPHYVQEHGEFFDVGGLIFPREYVLREVVNVVVLPVLRSLCGSM